MSFVKIKSNETIKKLGLFSSLPLWRRFSPPFMTNGSNCNIFLSDCYFCNRMVTLMGHAVAQLVEAPRYKPVGCGFDSRWCHWNFFIDIILPAALWPSGVGPASNRNEYQKYFLGGKGGRHVWLMTLPPSSANRLEIWEPQPPGTLRACPGL